MAEVDDIRNEALRRYGGDIAVYLNNNELWPIIFQAVQENRDELWITSQIHQTKFWKSTSLNQRTWDELKAVDPATAAEQARVREQEIQQQADAMGIRLDPSRRSQLANQSLRDGWDASQIRTAVSGEYHYDPNATIPGQAQVNIAMLKEEASNWGVPVSDATMGWWNQQILGGVQTKESWDAYLLGQAKSMYPHLSQVFDTGVSLRQYADPYIQLASRTLELAPDSIMLNDPKWLAGLVTTDPKTGQRTSMSLSDWTTKLKTDPQYGYDRTQQAREQAADLNARLGKMFGFTG